MVLAIGLLAMLLGGAAQAQEDLAAGKSPAQLFTQNCAMCHKSARGLAAAGDKAGGLFGLDNFLAQHYTASGRSAAILAEYLKSVDKGRASVKRSRKPHRDAAKKDENKDAKKIDKKVEEKAEKKVEKKPDKPAEVTDEAPAKPKADKPKMEEPAAKKPAPHDEARRDKPKMTGAKTTGSKPVEKKTD